ncbi:MAG: NADH-quinone oxidoreductase subunit L, partial [Planctomycetota bacterium]
MDPSLAPFAYITLFAPLVAAVVAGLFVRKQRALASGAAITGIVAGLACTLYLLFASLAADPGEESFRHRVEWIIAGDLTFHFGVIVDRLSLLMSLVVTGVGSCIFIYSVGYMHDDESYGRFFACLSLFAFSMLGIVFSSNLFQTFVFWELVGLSSYLLIGFWFGKDSAVEAGKKAFMVNRVGDFGFLCGILLLLYTVSGIPAFSEAGLNGMDFQDLSTFYRGEAPMGFGAINETTAAIAAVLIFCGAVGKSAQFPLHVWLPDAMEGPTPVSALMHAATMVAAGVYMVSRCYFLFEPFPMALHTVAWIGGITAFIAATIALVQFDVKKVLAYSTLSQLGYMVMALGLGSATAAMFHLTTHAFFKALLFLGSGSVIHGCHHEQDMRHMGGLRKLMPSTYRTWMIGTAALIAVPGFSGFFSKDEILAAAAYGGHKSYALLAVGLVTAGLTAFYMVRATVMTFFGEYRGHADPHESPAVMTFPLWVLAVPSIFVGFLGFPWVSTWFQTEFQMEVIHPHKAEFHVLLAVVGTAFAGTGFFLGYLAYVKKTIDPAQWAEKWSGVHRLLVNKWYFDDIYLWFVRSVQQRFAELMNFIEQNILIKGVIDGIAAGTRGMGNQLRGLQNGSVQTYVRFAVM